MARNKLLRLEHMTIYMFMRLVRDRCSVIRQNGSKKFESLEKAHHGLVIYGLQTQCGACVISCYMAGRNGIFIH